MDIKERIETAKATSKNILDLIYEAFPHRINYLSELLAVQLLLERTLKCTALESEMGAQVFVKEHNAKFKDGE